MTRLIDRVRETIKRHRMLEEGDSVLVAVSGGADSMALLHALIRLRGEFSLKLSVCHLNHNLRGASSRRDMSFVKGAARALKIPFIGKTLPKRALGKRRGESLQAEARRARYSFFEEAARKAKADKTALGHTLDDQAETVLMRLMKGAGPEGLSGIPPVRDRFIRPLIETERAEIENFLRGEGAGYVTDQTNLKSEYLRNDIRLNLIPFIERRYNPNIKATLARVSSTLRETDSFLESESGKAYLKALKRGRGGGGGGGGEGGEGRVVLDRARLRRLHPALLKMVFLRAASVLGKRAQLTGSHIGLFVNLVKGGEPAGVLRLPGPLFAKREYDRLIISSASPEGKLPGRFDVKLKVPGKVRAGAGYVKATLIKRSPKTIGMLKGGPFAAYFDYRGLKTPLRVRSTRPGDRIVPFGMKGHKKLKEVLIEAKVPREVRRLVPVLTSGGTVLWAAGLKRSDLCRVTGSTGEILKVEYFASSKPSQ